MTLKNTIWAIGLVGAAGYCANRPNATAIAYLDADKTLGSVVELTARQRGEAVTAVLIPEPRADVQAGLSDARDLAYAESALATPDVVAVVGHTGSRGALLAAPIYSEARVPFIAPTATSRRLRAAGSWTFQLAPDDEAEGAFIAHFALDSLAARAVSIFYLVDDEYGIGLRDGIADALRSRGVEPADEVGASLRRRTPDAVVIAARTSQAIAVARAVRARLPRVTVILADAVENDAFARALGTSLGPVRAVAWWRADRPDTASRAFVRRFEQVAGRPPRQQEAMYYDAIMVAAEAAHEAGPRPAAVRRWLSQLGVTRPAYHGVTGPISFVQGRPTNLVMVRLAPASPAPAPLER